MPLQEDLREFIELLNSHGVEYLVVGGHAVAFHGYPRFTGDIDFLIRRSGENARRVIAVLVAFGFDDLELDEIELAKPEQVIQLGQPPHRIDILTSASGLDFEAAWNSAIDGKLDGLPVRFPDLKSLIANKRAAGRVKDLADIHELEKITPPE